MTQKQDHKSSKLTSSPPLGTITDSSEGHFGVQSTQQKKVSTAIGVTSEPPKYLGLIFAELPVLAKTSAASKWEDLSKEHHFLPLSKPLSDCLSKALGRWPPSLPIAGVSCSVHQMETMFPPLSPARAVRGMCLSDLHFG